MKNKKLIEILKQERKKLYPNGLLIRPRGCGKIYTYLAHTLSYVAYDVVIAEYKNIDREVSLQEAHRDMDEFVVKMWQQTKANFLRS